MSCTFSRLSNLPALEKLQIETEKEDGVSSTMRGPSTASKTTGWTSKSLPVPNQAKKKHANFHIVIGDRTYRKNPHKGVVFVCQGPHSDKLKKCRFSELRQWMLSMSRTKGVVWAVHFESRDKKKLVFRSPTEARRYVIHVMRTELSKPLERVLEEC